MGGTMEDRLGRSILLAVVVSAFLAGRSAREGLGVSVDDPLAEPAAEGCDSDWADCDFEAR